MLLIDHHADAKLISRLEELRADARAMNCLELGFSKLPPEVRLSQNEVVRMVKQAINQQHNEAQLYFSDDGDVYVVCERMLMKELRQIAAMLPFGQYTTIRHYELDLQVNTLLVQLEAKIETQRAQEDVLKQRVEAERNSKKRLEILDYAPDAGWIARARAQRQTRTQHALMIVEDDVFSRRLLENVLPKTMEVTSLGESKSVPEQYTIVMPDIVFLDINLPDVNGHDLLQKILTIDPDAYVIMISGNSDRDNVTRAITKGARGFIAKPFARERLYDYIARCPTIRKH